MTELLKDKYSPDFFEQFINIVKSRYTAFEENKFMNVIYDGEWDQKELKERMRHISIALNQTISEPYEDIIKILIDIAPECSGFEYLFFPDFVEVYGQEDWEVSMTALEHFTKYSSSEFAVRAFIMKNESKMMEQMKCWALNENHHVRRLATEGCRPRLPWAAPLTSFKKDPSLVIPILEQLKKDPSKYVQKSVANNLNDISKDHPAIVKEIIRKWSDRNPETEWILKHGSRTLLKNGDVETLHLFGYATPKDISVDNLSISKPKISLGETLTFSFNLNNESEHPQKLRVEYAIYFVKANGKQSKKIFHLSQKNYKGGVHTLTRKHVFKNLTTRKHYSGKHAISLLVNGEEKATTTFELLV
ncbi:DNA alkylation repair protein [Saliterribacillus persicus]|uniref:3-methyladenine DNA glycosylase AlkC n=1 Tax=Saliterribacillus persicus TaxID=930114 RepID=A0A368XKK2_9BACI|nr:DNA alkylation repair protein [Saliterribacillus persicus]RCW67027.1 3-methyladenine DNA glycosylase AlkC [Saliterribacillus persicus]